MAKKKTATANLSTIKDKPANHPLRYDLFTLREIPYSDAWIEQLAHDMIKWATEDEDALILTEFYNLRGIRSNDIDRFGERWPGILEARQRTLDILSVRREKGGLKRKYDASMVQNTMPLYSREYKELVEWKAMLAAKAREGQEHTGPQFIVLEKFPDSPQVPMRKVEKSEG